MTPTGTDLHGVMAEFGDPGTLVAAARRAYDAGYRRMDGYSPFPVEGLHEALGHHHTRLPLLVLFGGVIGGVGGYALQLWVSVVAYPLNVGGRPFHSWPAFVPVTFECAILAAALTAVLGMLALNRLPMPHHPVLAVPRFSLASRDRFFLCIGADDPSLDRDRTHRFLAGLDAAEVTDVEA
jgi:hypothetical protein